MIITKLIGGLGNQMFQYAAGRALAARLNVPLYIDKRAFDTYTVHAYGLDRFNIQAVDMLAEDMPWSVREGIFWKGLRKFKLMPAPDYYRERAFVFDHQVLGLKDGTYLDGYWQSERYFNDMAEIIRTDFEISTVPSLKNSVWLKRIRNTNSVSVHIRRGDYVNNAEANSFHGTCSLDYYQRAISVIKEKRGSDLELFVFSDDLDWVKTNLVFGNLPHHFVDGNDANTNYEDLRLMSSCCHHIIANSTFSWWGAWLNPRSDKTVIAPLQWFRNESMDDSDLIPTCWLRI